MYLNSGDSFYLVNIDSFCSRGYITYNLMYSIANGKFWLLSIFCK